MAHTEISFGRRIMSGVAVAGGAAALATGMALAGAGTAAADNQQNVLTGDGNKFSPSSGVSAAAADPGTNFLTNVGTAISNAQIHSARQAPTRSRRPAPPSRTARSRSARQATTP